MKFSCLQENLNKGLDIVQKSVGNEKSNLQILKNILLSIDKGRLKLTATDLEMTTVCWVGAKVEEEGSITVPARLFTSFIDSLSADKVDIVSKNNILNIKCSNQKSNIRGLDSKDFPVMSAIKPLESFTIEPQWLHEMVPKITIATAEDYSRPVLTGINIKSLGKDLMFAAADGLRLSVYKYTLNNSESKIDIIVPCRSITELNRLCNQDSLITVNVDDRKANFKLENIELITQLIKGSYPSYESLIPKSFSTEVTMKSNDLLKIVKTSSVFSNEGSGVIRLIFIKDKRGTLTIKSQAEEIGENIGEIEVDLKGQELKIAFHVKYLSEILSLVKDEEIYLGMNSSSSPLVLKVVGNDNYTYVIMPMFVQW